MAKKEFPSDKLDQYIVRFPHGMRDRIKAEAEQNGRSMNAEIIARIEHSLNQRADAIISTAEAHLTRIEKNILRFDQIVQSMGNEQLTQLAQAMVLKMLDGTLEEMRAIRTQPDAAPDPTTAPAESQPRTRGRRRVILRKKTAPTPDEPTSS